MLTNPNGDRLPPKKQRAAYAQHQPGRNTERCKYLIAHPGPQVYRLRNALYCIGLPLFRLQANLAAID